MGSKYTKKNGEVIAYSYPREKTRVWEARITLRYLNMIFSHYGRRCACCGETNVMFLTVDHKNNDGKYDIGSTGRRLTGKNLYKRVIDSGFSDKYQILCMNCNWGKARNNGVCPHILNKYE